MNIIDSPTQITIWDKKETKKKIGLLKNEMSELLRCLNAQGKYSILLVLQGMDASGKDGVARRCFNQIGPNIVSSSSFKVPSKKELGHDFLWRVHKETPAKGEVKIFNRSHYEDVLVTRHLNLIDDEKAKKQFELINNFEKLLMHNNTVIIKCYLHISKEQQEENLLERKTDPRKLFKHNETDWQMRKAWDQFMTYYQEAINNCNKPPWNIIPSDKNWQKDYAVLKTICRELKKLDLQYPGLP